MRSDRKIPSEPVKRASQIGRPVPSNPILLAAHTDHGQKREPGERTSKKGLTSKDPLQKGIYPPCPAEERRMSARGGAAAAEKKFYHKEHEDHEEERGYDLASSGGFSTPAGS
jgi:hypothetical protein